MDLSKFLETLLGITEEFKVISIDKITSPEKILRIHIGYISKEVVINRKSYGIYDMAQEREWQHLNCFDYKCYIVGHLPRYLDDNKKVKTYEPSFASKGYTYTNLFAASVLSTLQKVKVQKTVAELLKTTPYIVRSIMEMAVEYGLEQRGLQTNLTNISIDEKAYAKGHEYATVVIDSDAEYIVDMIEGRKEQNLKVLLTLITGEEKQPQLKRVNMDMWAPYQKAIEEVAPQAVIVHDKFHVIKKLSEAINHTRREEVKTDERLKGLRFTVLKNKETRTEKQEKEFKIIDEENLKTTQAWHIRENFKYCWNYATSANAATLLKEWIAKSKEKGLKFVDKAISTIESHTKGILNGFITKTNSALHENKNSFLQSIIAKARGFRNFDRFRINALFYYGNLDLNFTKFLV